MGWYQVLRFRHQILEGKYQTERGFAAICQNPLAPRFAPISNELVSPLHPTEAIELAGFYAMPGYADEIKEWSEAQGTGTPADILLRRIFGQAPPREALPDLHRRSLDFLREGVKGVQSFTDRFATTADVRIDLAVDDETLVHAFKAWLCDERTLMDDAGVAWRRPVHRGNKGKARFSEGDLQQWARLRVLDYLDFQIGSKASGQRMPSAERLGAWLFPSESTRDVTDRVRQQVKKMARWLLTKPVLDALHTQAVAEQLVME